MRLCSGVPSFTREFVLFDLAEAEGRAWLNGLIESGPWSSAERVSDGYVAQEVEEKQKVESRKQK